MTLNDYRIISGMQHAVLSVSVIVFDYAIETTTTKTTADERTTVLRLPLGLAELAVAKTGS